MEKLPRWAAEFGRLAGRIWKNLPRKTVVPIVVLYMKDPAWSHPPAFVWFLLPGCNVCTRSHVLLLWKYCYCCCSSCFVFIMSVLLLYIRVYCIIMS